MDILSLVEAAWEERRSWISLFASENAMSARAMAAMASDVHNRYLLPDDKPPTIWDYPGQEPHLAIHRRVVELANGLYGSEHAELRPLSGNNAAYVLLNALARRGDLVLHVPADCGGHFATEPICRREGIELLDIPWDRNAGAIRCDDLAALVRDRRPKLVFLDASMVLFPYPLSEIRAAVGPETTIAYDASHVFGLLAGGRFQDPLAEGADLLCGSTHKTLFGPQKGMILAKGPVLGRRISEIVVPLFVSNAHLHHIAALGVALEELRDHGPAYADQTIANARALAAELHRGGIEVCGADRGFTDCHQLWCALGSEPTAKAAFRALDEIGIGANLIRVPMTDQFGLRLGTAELTRRGFAEPEVRAVGRLMVDMLVSGESRERLRGAVADLALSRPGLVFCDDPEPS